MNTVTSKAKKSSLALIFILLFFTAALVFNPERYMESVTSGLLLFARAVLPSLLPFFFFSKLLTSLDIASVFSSVMRRPMRFLYRAPSVSGYVMVMAMLSGYPVGAKLIAELSESNLITKADARVMTGFCLTSGPLFIIGAVGATFLQNKLYGVILLVAHFLAALLNGFLYRGKRPSNNTPVPLAVNYDRILSDAITNTVINLLVVGAYIAIFSMIIDVLYDAKILTGFATLLSQIGLDPFAAEGLASGLIEMTRGAELLSQSALDPKIVLAALGFLIGFGGMSIALQSVTFLKKAGVSALRYFLQKLTHGLISAGLTYLISFLILG